MTLPVEYAWILSVLALLVIAIEALLGYKNGFVKVAFSLIASLLCLALAWYLAGTLCDSLAIVPEDLEIFTESLAGSLMHEQANRVALFILLYILLKIICAILLHVLKFVNKIPLVGAINKLFGIVLGLAEGCIIVMLLTFCLNLPLFSNGSEMIDASYLTIFDDAYHALFEVLGIDASAYEGSISTESLDEEDVEEIIEWALEQEFTQDDVQTILDSLSETEIEDLESLISEYVDELDSNDVEFIIDSLDDEDVDQILSWLEALGLYE